MNAAEPDPLLEFASETPVADVRAHHAASVSSPVADSAPAECARCVRAARQRRITPRQSFGAAAAAFAVAIWGWAGEPVFAPVAALPMTSVESQPEVQPSPPLASDGRIVVISDPPGARVIVNGIGWGDTPLTLRYLPLGDQRVLVRRPGYVSQERSVRLEPERNTATVRVKLTAEQSAEDPSGK